MRPACVQNFKPISLFLAVQWPRNQVMVMTSLFWNSIFGICNCRTTKQMAFLEFWDKTGQDRYVLKRKFRFSKRDLFYLNLTWPEVKCENECHHQGCGVGVETGVGVGRGRPFWSESESELESVKCCWHRLRPGVAGYPPSTDDDFDPTVIHPSENIERLEEKW